jgi:hypothetical protein
MKLHFAIAGLLTVLSIQAEAVIRPIIIPGKSAIIMLQAVSSVGGGKIDPEPRELFDAIAMPAVASGGGEGKVIGTAEKDFSLTCAFRSVVTPLNVLCTINVKPSPRTSKVSLDEVEFVAEGPVALEFFEKFAGPDSIEPWVWVTKNGWISIESRQDRFVFRYQR